MPEDLRKKFDDVRSELGQALTKYTVGKDTDVGMQVEGQKQAGSGELQQMVDEVERAIQKRLRYDEA